MVEAKLRNGLQNISKFFILGAIELFNMKQYNPKLATKRSLERPYTFGALSHRTKFMSMNALLYPYLQRQATSFFTI